MSYLEVLRNHARKAQTRTIDIPVSRGLGIVEEHSSIPQTYFFNDSSVQHADKQKVKVYDQLLQDSLRLNIDTGAFPADGYLGKGVV